MTKYYWGDRISNEIGWAYSANGNKEKSTQSSAGKKDRKKGRFKALEVHGMVRINRSYKT
jgi:hypothetical protein